MIRNHRYAEAQALLADAISLKPNLASLHLSSSVALLGMGKIAEARQEALYSLTLDGYISDTYIQLAAIETSRGAFKEASDIYETYLKRFPFDSQRDFAKDSLLTLQSEMRRFGQAAQSPQQRGYYNYLQASDGALSWQKRNLKVFIPKRSPASELLRASFLDWQACAQGEIIFQFTNDPYESDISCSFSESSSGLSGQAKAGETETSIGKNENGKCYIKSAKLKIRCIANDGCPYPEEKLYGICLHEIGHALGLSHSSSCNDIMFFFSGLTTSAHTISSADKESLLKLLGSGLPD